MLHAVRAFSCLAARDFFAIKRRHQSHQSGESGPGAPSSPHLLLYSLRPAGVVACHQEEECVCVYACVYSPLANAFTRSLQPSATYAWPHDLTTSSAGGARLWSHRSTKTLLRHGDIILGRQDNVRASGPRAKIRRRPLCQDLSNRPLRQD